MKSGASLTWLVAVAMVAAIGCGSTAETASQSSDLRVPEGAALDGDFSGTGSGTLVSANVLPNIDIDISDNSSLAARMTYISASGVNNNYIKVTGTVFVPRGAKPRGGWPTVALAHPMTGIQPDCAPSLSRNLLQLAPVVADLLRAGFAVTVPDYQGLGNRESYHPFLDSTTVGSNLIDSVRAARKFVKELSDRWVGLGIDQGGQAAWAANELVVDFGGGLQLLGSVSVSPFSDLEGLADAAAAGTLTTEQKLVYVQYLAALKSQFPDFDLDSYRRGLAADSWDALLGCEGAAAASRQTVAGQLSPDDLRPSSPQAVEDLRGFLRKTSLPQGVTSAPMLVTYGAGDPVIPLQWTDQALVKACGFGDVVQVDRQQQMAPGELDVPRTVEWIKDRVAGAPPVNDCAALPAIIGGQAPPPAEPTTTESSPTEVPTAEPEPTYVEEPTVETTTAPPVTTTVPAPPVTTTAVAPPSTTTGPLPGPAPVAPVAPGPLNLNPQGPAPGPAPGPVAGAPA